MEDVFDVLVPFIFIAAAEPVVIFVGYNFLIADQNLGERCVTSKNGCEGDSFF